MHELIDYILDFIFPRESLSHNSIHCYLSESEINSANFFKKDLDLDLNNTLEQVFVASDFNNEVLQDLIYRAKFSGETAICSDLAKLVFESVIVKLDSPPHFFIPVPSDPKRFTNRGYHLPYLIADNLSKLTKIPNYHLISKTEHTKSQIELTKLERSTNLDNKFKLDLPEYFNLAKFQNIYLIDDLTTTGTTFLKCSEVIKKEFPFLKIYGIAVASN